MHTCNLKIFLNSKNPGAASLSKIPESRSRQSVNEESGVEMAQDIPSLTATEEHYEGRGTPFFSPNVFSETGSLLLPVQLDKSQPRKIDGTRFNVLIWLNYSLN